MSKLAQGFKDLYQWQHAAFRKLQAADHKMKRNFIYSSPTGGGKSLVADLLALYEVRQNKGCVLYLIPYISLIRQRVIDLRQQFAKFNLKIIELFFGSSDNYNKKFNIAVTTIEQACKLVHSFLKDPQGKNVITMVVIDEFHVFFSGERGFLLENLLVKLNYSRTPVQVIGMSATFLEQQRISNWLDAITFTNDVRPVKLYEYIVTDETIQIKQEPHETTETIKCTQDSLNSSLVSDLVGSPQVCFKNCPNDLLSCNNVNFSVKTPLTVILLRNLVSEKNNCICFCRSKKQCELLGMSFVNACDDACIEFNVFSKRAEALKLLIPGKSTLSDKLNKLISEKRNYYSLFDIVDELEQLNLETRRILFIKLVLFGCCIHNSTLLANERELIEKLFTDNVISVLFCTSTLAAGMNLPANVVVINGVQIGQSLLGVLDYRQMIGRAGRKGFSETGRSYLVVQNKKDFVIARSLVGSDLYLSNKPTRSIESTQALILEVITIKGSLTNNEILNIFKLLYTGLPTLYTDELKTQEVLTKLVLRLLVRRKFISVDEDNVYFPTELGLGATEASVIDAYLLLRQIEVGSWSCGSKLLPIFCCSSIQRFPLYGELSQSLFLLYTEYLTKDLRAAQNYAQRLTLNPNFTLQQVAFLPELLDLVPARELVALSNFGINIKELLNTFNAIVHQPQKYFTRVLRQFQTEGEFVPVEDSYLYNLLELQRLYSSILVYLYLYAEESMQVLSSISLVEPSEIESYSISVFLNSIQLSKLCDSLNWSVSKAYLNFYTYFAWDMLKNRRIIDKIVGSGSMQLTRTLASMRLTKVDRWFNVPLAMLERKIHPVLLNQTKSPILADNAVRDLYCLSRLSKKYYTTYKKSSKIQPDDLLFEPFLCDLEFRIQRELNCL